jgi:hypothetical protein
VQRNGRHLTGESAGLSFWFKTIAREKWRNRGGNTCISCQVLDFLPALTTAVMQVGDQCAPQNLGLPTA